MHCQATVDSVDERVVAGARQWRERFHISHCMVEIGCDVEQQEFSRALVGQGLSLEAYGDESRNRSQV